MANGIQIGGPNGEFIKFEFSDQTHAQVSFRTTTGFVGSWHALVSRPKLEEALQNVLEGNGPVSVNLGAIAANLELVASLDHLGHGIVSLAYDEWVSAERDKEIARFAIETDQTYLQLALSQLSQLPD